MYMYAATPSWEAQRLSLMLYDYYFLDWYSLFHFWWGTVYALILSPITIDGLEFWQGFLISVGIAVLFECVENSDWYIHHVQCEPWVKFSRDSWANMIGDVCSSSVGYGFMWWGGVDNWAHFFIPSCAIALGGGLILTQCVDPQDKERQRKMWL